MVLVPQRRQRVRYATPRRTCGRTGACRLRRVDRVNFCGSRSAAVTTAMALSSVRRPTPTAVAIFSDVRPLELGANLPGCLSVRVPCRSFAAFRSSGSRSRCVHQANCRMGLGIMILRVRGVPAAAAGDTRRSAAASESVSLGAIGPHPSTQKTSHRTRRSDGCPRAVPSHSPQVRLRPRITDATAARATRSASSSRAVAGFLLTALPPTRAAACRRKESMPYQENSFAVVNGEPVAAVHTAARPFSAGRLIAHAIRFATAAPT